VRIAGGDRADEMQEENDAVSLCSLYAGSETFGIDTRKIREVLGERDLQRVPMRWAAW
jgi:purine-binding chemotaxis protein CheW